MGFSILSLAPSSSSLSSLRSRALIMILSDFNLEKHLITWTYLVRRRRPEKKLAQRRESKKKYVFRLYYNIQACCCLALFYVIVVYVYFLYPFNVTSLCIRNLYPGSHTWNRLV
jgi:hypothetical protein